MASKNNFAFKQKLKLNIWMLVHYMDKLAKDSQIIEIANRSSYGS